MTVCYVMKTSTCITEIPVIQWRGGLISSLLQTHPENFLPSQSISMEWAKWTVKISLMPQLQLKHSSLGINAKTMELNNFTLHFEIE